MNRRNFLKSAGIAAQGLLGAAPGVSIIIDPGDPIASAPPPRWAAGELRAAFESTGLRAQVYPRLDAAPADDRCIVVAGGRSAVCRQVLKAANASMPSSPEALCLAGGNVGGRAVVLAGGSDVRGLVYAVLELADRVRYGGAPAAALNIGKPVLEKPANVIRSCARCFVSDVEDKSWYYDRGLWKEYLTMLAANRFSRFNLTFGIGYNSAQKVPDSYFYFTYPFLLQVPGYDVRAAGLPDAERDRNLETLRFIGEETVARGLQFSVALWSHAYEWPDPTNYRITGLTPENHARYCHDALLALLKACPTITSLSFRVHGESGVRDGSYDFWQTLFQAIPKAGRRIDIDLHAKATDQHHIDAGLKTGMFVSMAPKFWAEHFGMPYHQAAIRELELRPAAPGERNPAVARRFLRYGYGDYMKENRNFGIVHRIWPGTQRHLLWGDAATAAGYGRAFSFAGSDGVELCEPLSFKGRMGSGVPGGRNAYADKSLEPKYDFQKFLYQYRQWGRLIYNPDTDPDGWRRYLRHELRDAAQPAETALAHASRVLPVITTAHGPSASNNSYWPEMYMNMPIVDPKRAEPYRDTPEPRKFGTVSPFDPQLFSTVEECAEALVSGKNLAKYTPLDVAQWLDELSETAFSNRTQALARAASKEAPELRRLSADVAIQAGIGRFFAYKLRSGVLWSLYERTGDRTALAEAAKAYRNARQAWASMAEVARTVYAADVTYGPNANLRGNWFDRISGIDDDIADMEKRLAAANSATPPAGVDPAAVRRAVQTVLSRVRRPLLSGQHTPPAHFEPGNPLELSVSFGGNESRKVNLLYRHADQSKPWQAEEMQLRDRRYRAAIPAGYTQSPYPLLYYFEVHDAGGSAIYPGFNSDLSNQPYFLVRSNRRRS